jgi:hypothetical protein
MLKIGDTVTVSGWLAKDVPNQFAAREMRWPDGRKFIVGPASQN